MTIPAYPVQWPEGLPRNERRATSAFKTSLSGALANVRDSLRLFGSDSGQPVSEVVISSSVSIGELKPADPGVAVWFIWDGEHRYPKPEDNLQAIHHVLEARRTEMRHGGLHIARQAFRGFMALPAPPGSTPPEPWWQALGVVPTAAAAEIQAAYRAKARAAHPDTGGSHAIMSRLNAARDAGLAAASKGAA